MRINEYRFPEDHNDPQVRFNEGAEGIDGHDDVCTDAGYVVSGISITSCKEMLKKYGGSAWTLHIDRDGSIFEVTNICLNKNNSKHKYNRHL